MKKKTNIFFSYLAYPIVGLVLSGLFFYLSIGQSEPNSEIKKLQDFLDKNIMVIEASIQSEAPMDSILRGISPFIWVEVKDSSQLLYWNQSTQNKKGYYHYRDTIHRDSLQITYGIPIYHEQFMDLNPEIIAHLNTANNYRFAPEGGTYILDIRNRSFEFNKVNVYPRDYNFSLYILFLLISFFLFIIILGWKIKTLSEWIIYSITTVFFRALLYFLSNYQEWSFLDVFSIANDISNINKSIGDFWINLIVLTILTLSLRKIPTPLPEKKELGILVKVLNGCLIGFLLVYYSQTVEGFILDNRINLNVEKVLTLDIYSILLLLGLVYGHAIIFGIALYSIYWTKNIPHKLPTTFLAALGIIVTVSFAYYSLSYHPLILAGYAIAFVSMIDLYLDNRSNNLIWLIWWGTILSAFTGCLIYYESLRKDINLRKTEIQEIYNPTDRSLKNQVAIIDSILVNSDFSENLANLPFPGIVHQDDIKSFTHSLISKSLSSDLNLENILIFDKYNNNLFQESGLQFYDINQKIKLSHRIGKNQFYNPFQQGYYLLYNIETNYYPTGPFRVIITLRNPNLNLVKLPSDLIIIKNKEIIIPSIQTIDEGLLAKLNENENEFYYSGFSVLKEYFPDNFEVISTKKIASILKPMSLFSYVFAILGLLIFAISLMNSKFNFLYYPLKLHLLQKRSLRNTIQVGLIALIIFSFIAIGLLTAVYFKNVLEEKSIADEREIVYEFLEKLNSDIQSATNSDIALANIQSKLRTVDQLISTEIKLYNENGKILNLDVPNDQHRIPYQVFNQETAQNLIQNTDNGLVTIQYIPLYLDSEKPFAFLSIQDDNRKKFSESILDFLSTLLNVYVFLFLLAAAIAVLISNSITKPLAILADKFRAFKLGKQNEPLEWNREDEIGALIKDYNNLIYQLEESARIIAKTERDTAWREMAKQVAHEIKNPLTPMKLSIQYLERSLKESGGENKDMISKVSNTLLEQINNLSEIASEFSNFAKMPQSNNEKIVLNDIVEAVHDLFRKRDDMDIKMMEPLRDLVVFADRGQLVRILNNLVKNAIQAIPSDRRGKIIISLYEQGLHAVIKVSDNGIGIPDEMKNKVFTPNFTTKSSGTGLGLAISANIIDGFNGKLYFDTEVGIGTNFFVEIPLMRLEEQLANGKRRVVLE